MKNLAEYQSTFEKAMTTFHERISVDQFRKLLFKNKILPKKCKVILIAGTNGKGTTSMLLEYILQLAGYRTGSFISPHLYNINERIRIDGKTVDSQLFCQHFANVEARYDMSETHWFGFILLVALNIFQQFPLDFLIVEAGVGGKNCLTNALEPDVAIVTTVAMDHMNLLGDDREQIGVQKAGIFRSNKPAICGDPDPPDSMLEYAKEIGTNLYIQARDFHYQLQKQTWDWTGFGYQLINLPQPKMPLQNASTALAALMALKGFVKLNEQAISKALINVFIPGRYQCITTQPTVICDVAHNPQAVAWVATKLANDNFLGKTVVVVAMRPDKLVTDTLAAMSIPIAAWFLADLKEGDGFVQQAVPFLQAQHGEVHVADSVVSAFKKAEAITTENDRIVVFGSFRTVREVFSLFPQARREIT